MPSYRYVLPDSGKPELRNSALISLSFEPSNTGEPVNTPRVRVGAKAASSSSSSSEMASAKVVSLNRAFSSRRMTASFEFSFSHSAISPPRDVDLDQLAPARRQFVSFGQLVFLFVDDLLEHVDLTRGHFLDLIDLLIHSRILVGVLDPLQVTGRDALDGVAVKDRVLGQ